MRLFGCIHAEENKFVCAIGDLSGTIREKTVIKTTTPRDTVFNSVKFLLEKHQLSPLSAIGISSFGPVDPDPDSPYYGYITTTTRPGWAQFNIVGSIKDALGLPVGFDTDVNGAAIGEARWGAGKEINSLIYWTIGCGIGGGGLLSDKMMHGLIHPEMGHMYVPHDRKQDPYKGVCPYHKNCLEGLASVHAIRNRWGFKSAKEIPDEHPAWDLEAKYLGYAMANCVMSLSPQRIIIGGGVMNRKILYPKIRKETIRLLNGYIKHKELLTNIESFIVPPALGEYSELYGALALAEMQLRLPQEI